MPNLTLAQRVTLNAINLAPRFTKDLKTDDTFKFARGVVNGLFDKRVLKALQNKGLVEILGDNDGKGSYVLVA